MPRKSYPLLTEIELKPIRRTKKGGILFQRFKLKCCDCHLVHDFAFAVEENGNLGIALRRNNRSTNALRRNQKRAGCCRCEVYDAPTATCRLRGIGYYDVKAAERLVKRKPRKPLVLTMRGKHRLSEYASGRGCYAPHVEHVNTRKYGILGLTKQKGNTRTISFLIDGNHRARKCFLRRRSFKVYVLTLEETASVFLGYRAPKGKQFTT